MPKRLPTSMRTRESRRRLTEGAATKTDGHGDLVKSASG